MLFRPMMVTSKSSNIAAITVLPSQLQAEFGGFFWLVAAAVAAATITAAHLIVVRGPLSDELANHDVAGDVRQRLADMGPASPSEWVAAGSFVFFLLGIATVPWHHVKPPYLAGCVLLALLVTGTLRKARLPAPGRLADDLLPTGIDSLMRVMDHLGWFQAPARVMRRWFDFIDGEVGLLLLATLLVTATLRLVLPYRLECSRRSQFSCPSPQHRESTRGWSSSARQFSATCRSYLTREPTASSDAQRRFVGRRRSARLPAIQPARERRAGGSGVCIDPLVDIPGLLR